jgi:hypothetical protein
MPIFNDAFTEHEIKRGMRPDAHRYLRPDWRRFLRAGYENDSLYRLYESIERKIQLRSATRARGQPRRRAVDERGRGVGKWEYSENTDCRDQQTGSTYCCSNFTRTGS